jgi:selenocysteine-specific elongation factor
MEPRHAILATAGHIDHGKSALVKALTGNDPDRLPEEKQRGITIDLGFAHLELPEHSLGIVDVPGHQDFVKNMVAGVGAVDLALLVVAADDGWMPQTEEHLQILTYLGASRGVVALTKADLIEDPTERIEQIRKQLANSPLTEIPIIPTSAHNGEGLEELKEALALAAQSMPVHTDCGQPRLAVDRVFSLQGIGTIATGTLTGGTIKQGQSIEAYPPGKTSRIRSVQSHNRGQNLALPGTRTALSLSELTREELPRGATLTLPELAGTTQTIDVYLERSPRLPTDCTPLRNDTRVRVHHGSGHWPARLVLVKGKTLEPGEKQLAQLRMEQPACIWPGDRIVIRNWPESATLAGGRVLDSNAKSKNLRTDSQKTFLNQRAEHPTNLVAWIESELNRDGLGTRSKILRPSHFPPADIEEAIDAMVASKSVITAGQWIVKAKDWNTLRETCSNEINKEHQEHPERAGLALEQLRPLAEAVLGEHNIFEELISDLEANGFKRHQTHIASRDHKPALPAHLRDSGNRIRKALQGDDPPARKNFNESPTGRAALQFLVDTGEVIDVGPELVMSAAQYNRLKLVVKQHLRKHGQATASELRKAMETTRRILIPVLEKMDRDGLTARRGDVRVLRKED